MSAQQEYDRLIADGLAPTLAEMFATRRPPGCRTSREFLAGHCNGNQFATNQWAGDKYRKIAQAHGQNTTGKVYLSQLAAFPGDPEAWVSDEGDVKRVCEQRGWNCNGFVNVKAPQLDHDPDDDRVMLADDIVEDCVEAAIGKDPSLALKPREELREMAIDKHGPKA